MDLSVNYMGLELKNPIIVGSSGLTNSAEKIHDLEKQGAAAVVLKSLFEEQILMEEEKSFSQNDFDYPEAMDYMKKVVYFELALRMRATNYNLLVKREKLVDVINILYLLLSYSSYLSSLIYEIISSTTDNK